MRVMKAPAVVTLTRDNVDQVGIKTQKQVQIIIVSYKYCVQKGKSYKLQMSVGDVLCY